MSPTRVCDAHGAGLPVPQYIRSSSGSYEPVIQAEPPPSSQALLSCGQVSLPFSPRAGMVACDFGATLAGGFDLVVANPPYIAISEIAALAPEVRHDPLRALDGGHDGLAAYRAIAADARRLIKPLGHLVLELGAGQLNAVTKLLQAQNLLPGSVRSDLNGIARALTASVATMTR